MRETIFLFILISLFFAGCSTVPTNLKITGAPGVYHIVAHGQNLYRISKVYGVDIKEIIKANNLKSPNQIEIGQKLFIPKPGIPIYIEPYHGAAYTAVQKLVGEKQYRIHWRTITLHHSATQEGNALSFDRNHRHRGMGGLFYHFVIGNGNGSGDGQIEVGWRWRRQVEANRLRDIQICLVGDFNKQVVTPAQFNSLMVLLTILKQQYSIPVSNIRTHKSISGKITECPGNNFPFFRIVRELRKT